MEDEVDICLCIHEAYLNGGDDTSLLAKLRSLSEKFSGNDEELRRYALNISARELLFKS